MKDNKVTNMKNASRIVTLISIVTLCLSIVLTNHAVNKQTEEILRLSQENQQLAEKMNSLQKRIDFVQTVLNDLHISDMTIQDKLSDIDIILYDIEKEHRELQEANTVTPLSVEPVIEQIPEEIKIPTFNPSDITELSNLTLDQMKIITDGTRFVGYEKYLLKLEKEHNVNVIFAISNSIQECGWLKTNGYTKRNNYFGIDVKEPFDSMTDCLDYYFWLIDVHYVNKRGLKTIESIQHRYCPEDASWDNDIIWIGNKLINKLNVTVE